MTDTTTTTTQHWLLAKYSRSRSLLDTAPSPATAASNNDPRTVAGQGSDDNIQWDHYSQPQLALRLDSTFASSPSSSTPSSTSTHPLRMVLSVTFDPLFRDPDRGGTQQPLLLDSLDLTAFSSRGIRAATPHDQLPLKAVYRDAVLGLRYLSLSTHARSAPNRPQVEFRRLQAKFTSTAERERFVDAVGALVPAKPAVEAEPAPVAAPVPPPKAKKLKVGPPSPEATKATKPAKPTTKKNATTPRSRKKQPVKKVQPASPSPPPPPPHPHEGDSPPAFSTAHGPPTTAATPLPPSRPHFVQPAHSTPRLPATLSTLLPNLATASTSTASQLLAALAPHDFEQLLQDALLEDGFEQLVERVQGTLMGG
ncbi:hypothetical protein JCM3775_003363 [Rhodotorula graminis]